MAAQPHWEPAKAVMADGRRDGHTAPVGETRCRVPGAHRRDGSPQTSGVRVMALDETRLLAFAKVASALPLSDIVAAAHDPTNLGKVAAAVEDIIAALPA